MAVPWLTLFENLEREFWRIEEDARALDAKTKDRVSFIIRILDQGPTSEETQTCTDDGRGDEVQGGERKPGDVSFISETEMKNTVYHRQNDEKESPQETGNLSKHDDKMNVGTDQPMTKESLPHPDDATEREESKIADIAVQDSPTGTGDLSKSDDETDVDTGITRTEEPSSLPGDASKEGEDKLADMPVQNGGLSRLTSTDDGEERFYSCVSCISTSSTSMVGADEVEAAETALSGDHMTVRAQDSGECVCGHRLFDSLQDEKQHQVALQCQKCRGAWVIQPTGGQPANKKNHIRANWIKYYYNCPIPDMTQERKPVRDAVDLVRGDHIVLNRGGLYYHHAIVLRVFETSVEIIHWTTKGNAVKIDKGVQDIDGGANTYKVVYEHQDLAELVIARALFLMRYAREKYDLVRNNCESFAVFCKTGNSFSFQGKAMEGACPFVMNVATKVASFLDGQT